MDDVEVRYVFVKKYNFLLWIYPNLHFVPTSRFGWKLISETGSLELDLL